MNNEMPKWEIVTKTLNEHRCITDKTERLRVPGGWLYRNTCDVGTVDGSTQEAMSIVFVPEAEA